MKSTLFFTSLFLLTIPFNSCKFQGERSDYLEVRAYINNIDSAIVIPPEVIAEPLRVICNDSTFAGIPLKHFDCEGCDPSYVMKWKLTDYTVSDRNIHFMYLYSNTGVNAREQMSESQFTSVVSLFKDRWVEAIMIARKCDITSGGEINQVRIIPKSAIGGKLTDDYHFDSNHQYCLALYFENSFRILYLTESDLSKFIESIGSSENEEQIKTALNQELNLLDLWGIK
jgi:hypothetical protein